MELNRYPPKAAMRFPISTPLRALATASLLGALALGLGTSVPARAERPEAQASAGRGHTLNPDELGRALHAYLQRTVPFGFSGAVLLAHRDHIFLHEGYGLADREQRVPITAETVFDIGSITKQFTAAAILALEDDGRLRVTDSITRFFDDVPADKRGITLHHLLTHSAGLIGDLGGDYQVMPRDTLVRLALASELQWAPGTRYDYSNLGYSLLGAVVERVSGVPYERFLHDRLLQRAGLTRTGYRIPQWSARELAVGYRAGERWGTPLDHTWADDGPWWNLRANGGILSTMGDLFRWHRALGSDSVLSAAAREKLQAPHMPEDPEGSSHYGYGWAIFTTPRNTKLVAHNGGNGYFFADFHRYVDEEIVIVLATNDASQSAFPVPRRVIDAVLSGRAPALPPTATATPTGTELDAYAGSYTHPSGARVIVSRTGDVLVADAHGQGGVELLTAWPSEAIAENRRLNARADSALAAMMSGDGIGLRAIAADGERAEATFRRIRDAAERNMGAPRGAVVLGTVPSWWSERPTPATFVRLDFERGSRLFRLQWDGGRVEGFGGMAIQNPARSVLLAQGSHRFIGYNLGIEHPVPLRFERRGAAPATALIVTRGGDEVRLARQTD